MSDPIRIYLGGTIFNDLVDIKWKNVFKSNFPHTKDFIFYDPDPRIGSSYEVIPRDKKAIEQSDFVVAYIQEATFGTVMEIKHAFDRQNITIFVINPNQKHIKNIWLSYHCHRIFDTVESCARCVQETVNKMKIYE